jgi:aryl-alcohol dehydrogenase-like predicted oxidoreductase
MQYRTIGNTPVRVSEIGFGCGDNAGLIVRATTQERRFGVARALELGINYFDTSPDYGKGLSESNLGRVFRELRARPIIATKAEIMPGDEDDLAGAVVRSIEGSLRRLRMDFVDIAQVHNAPHAKRNLDTPGWVHLSVDDYLGPKGCLEGLERLQRDGKVRYLGFACEHAEGPAVKQLLDTGKFQMLNVWFDLLNPTSGWPAVPGMRVDSDYQQIVDYARAHGCGTAVIRPLAGGTLTDIAAGGGTRHPYAGGGLSRTVSRYQEMVDQAKCMAFLSQEGRHSLAQAAVRFSLSNPGVSSVLGGFSDVNQIEEMAVCSGAGPLSEENMARVEMAWRANFGKWNEQSWAA